VGRFRDLQYLQPGRTIRPPPCHARRHHDAAGRQFYRAQRTCILNRWGLQSPPAAVISRRAKAQRSAALEAPFQGDMHQWQA
jgi:hypothetical protein